MPKNRRQAFRCTISDVDAPASLRIRGGEFTVRVVDESASGFGVESDRKLAVDEGELATLTTKAGRTICQVMRAEYDDAGKTTIGLQRVNEIADQPTSSTRGPFVRRPSRSMSFSLLLAFGVGLAFALSFARFGSLPFLSFRRWRFGQPSRCTDEELQQSRRAKVPSIC
jgi:hypothetical protein